MTTTCPSVLALSLLACIAGQGTDEPVRYEAHPGKARGALTVAGDTSDSFSVYKGGRAVTAIPPLLSATVELEPGAYEARVNGTGRLVTVEAGKKAVLRTGTVVVTGDTTDSYQVYQGDKALLGNPALLNAARAFFPGRCEVAVNGTRQAAAVRPERKEGLGTGARVGAGEARHSIPDHRGGDG